MKKKLVGFLVCMLLISSTTALSIGLKYKQEQQPEKKPSSTTTPIFPSDVTFIKTFGGANYDYGTSVQQTSDGGCILTGKTWSSGASENDFLLIKTDKLGRSKDRAIDNPNVYAKNKFIRFDNCNVISPAEFDLVDELLISWPSFIVDYLYYPDINPYYVDLVSSAEDVLNVTINVNNIIHKLYVKTILLKNNVSLQNVTFSNIPTNSNWIRDYGPFFVYKDSELNIVDFRFTGYTFMLDFMDDLYPFFFGLKNRIRPYIFTNSLMKIQGGNYMSDGNKTGFVADRLFAIDNPRKTEEQVIERLKCILGLDELIVLKSQILKVSAGGDGNGHLDMFAKIVSEDTILVGQYNDTNDTNYQILEDNADYLDSLGYNVVRIPMLRNPENDRIWTYTNSLIINTIDKKVVLVPTYNTPTDQQALQIYGQLMPDYEIRSVNSRIIINSFGAIHCSTMTVPI